MRGFDLLGGAGLAVRAFAVLLVLAGAARADETAPPLRVVVFGDSQAQGIAAGLQRVLLGDPHYRVVNRTHAGAALVHDKNEWLGPVTQFAGKDEADVAIIMFGANDRLDMREGRTYLHFRSDEWRDAYAERIEQIYAALAPAHMKIIWCGNPIARSPSYSDDMNYINDIYDEAAAKNGATFFPLWSVIVDADGKFAAYGKDRNGVNQRLRGDDGIHFTAAGYEIIAEKLVNLLPSVVAKSP